MKFWSPLYRQGSNSHTYLMRRSTAESLRSNCTQQFPTSVPLLVRSKLLSARRRMRGSRPKSELELTEFSSRGKSESNILQCHQSVTPPVHHFKHPAVPSECYSTSSSLRVTFNLKHLLNNMMLLYFFADKTRSRKSDISILSQRSPPPSSLYLTLTLCKLSTIISKCQLHNYPS